MAQPNSQLWRSRWGVVLVVSVCSMVALAAGWRLTCVTLGPDPDTDAYGHYVIARQLLATPGNLLIHWVWLPGYHLLLALFVSAGLTLDDVRAANAVLAVAPSLLLLWGLGAKELLQSFRARCVAALAAAITATTPILIQMGTTAQMEVFFCVLVLGSVLLLERGRYAPAALVLSAAVLTRYEAWAVVAGIALVLVLGYLLRRVLPSAALLMCVLCPALAIFGWAGARWLQGEAWFGFLLDNQAFAERALHQTQPDARWLGLALARYPIILPLMSFGLPAAFALLGLRRTLREEGVWFVVVPSALLVFLMLSSLSRSHLGLDRHFLSLVPFIAVWMAHGVCSASESIARAWQRWRSGLASDPKPRWLARWPTEHVVFAASFAVFAAWTAHGQLSSLATSLPAWRETTLRALSAERAAGQFLATLPALSLIVCDEASVEVLSGLPSERFLRARVGPELTRSLLGRAQREDVFVISRSARVQAVAVLGPVVYASPEGVGFAALHVEAQLPASSTLSAGAPVPLQ